LLTRDSAAFVFYRPLYRKIVRVDIRHSCGETRAGGRAVSRAVPCLVRIYLLKCGRSSTNNW